MLALLLLAATTATSAHAGPVEWRAAVGGQLDSDSHGILDVGVREGPWSLQLLTDTLDARWTGEHRRGKAWAAVRAEGGAAGLFISPWEDGAPAPEQALLSHYVGAFGGVQRYLPHGFYVGVEGGARYQLFGATATTEIPVPDGRPVATADLVVGYWSESFHLWTRTGADGFTGADGWVTAPHAHVQAVAAPDWTVAPRAELRAGTAWNQDDVTRTRLGGMNPYVVPVAGAAWAEWWVEHYAAARLGVAGRLDGGDRGALRLMPFADLAVAPEITSTTPAGPWAVGLGLWARAERGRAFLDLAGGAAPWITRQDGVSPVSVFVLAGIDWDSGGRLFRTGTGTGVRTTNFDVPGPQKRRNSRS